VLMWAWAAALLPITLFLARAGARRPARAEV